jgi:hypothetical protein
MRDKNSEIEQCIVVGWTWVTMSRAPVRRREWEKKEEEAAATRPVCSTHVRADGSAHSRYSCISECVHPRLLYMMALVSLGRLGLSLGFMPLGSTQPPGGGSLRSFLQKEA